MLQTSFVFCVQWRVEMYSNAGSKKVYAHLDRMNAQCAGMVLQIIRSKI